jgi:hypothetical protein
MSRDKRPKRDVHALDEEGMVLCNPRDREAAHRAEMEGIAVVDGCQLLGGLSRNDHREASLWEQAVRDLTVLTVVLTVRDVTA